LFDLKFKFSCKMKNLFLVSVIALFATINLSAANRFVEKNFFSSALNQNKTYYVSYPDGYVQSDTTKKFPIIFFLHGASVNARDVVVQFDSIVSNPFMKFIFPNFYKVIFVIPDGSAPPFKGSFYSNSELYGNFETYIATDLYKEVHENYNTYDAREKWSIMGHSMGGYGSMKIALKYPNQFIGVSALSGPLNVTYYNDILPLLLAEHGNTPPYNFVANQGSVTSLIYSMAGAFSPNLTLDPPVNFPVLSDGTINQEVIPLWEAQNPINFIGKWKGEPNMAIYMYCGELDEYKLLSQNQLFSDSLTKYNIPHTFRIDPNGDHIFSLLTSFPLGLNFLYNVMDTSKINTNPNSIVERPIRKNYIFPVPAKNRLYYSSAQYDEIEKITIVSTTGSTIQTFSGKNIEIGLDISALRQGCYLFSVCYSDGRKKNYNFIKIE
jgi:S-formylglutathione hydrolase FrmB